MKRVLYLISFVLLAAITSCTNDRDAAAPISISEYVAQKPVPVTFGTYNADAPTTRAGQPGSINIDAQLKTKGFGVFAYYTENTNFNYMPIGTRNLIPDFMYNEHIAWDGTNNKWDYFDPDDQKFWPNDFNGNGNPVDTHGATGTTYNYISFFAYAPYAGEFTQSSATTRSGATPPTTSGDGTNSGVIAASGNNFNGDPFLTYRISNDATKMVDLVWGTAGGLGNGNNVVGTAQNGAMVTRSVDNGVATSVFAEDPTNIDMTKQETDGKVKFNFKHALAKVGGSADGSSAVNAGLMADLLIDTDGTTATADKPATTKVTIRSITITHDDATSGTPAVLTNAMPSTGVFNLATGKWIVTAADATDTNTFFTINHVISQNGAPQGNILNAAIMEPTTAPTAWTDLATIPGVLTGTKTNVYGTEATPILFLPGTTPHLKFTIEYCVRTQDAKLAKGFTEVWQKITKTIAFTSPVEINKQYNIAMHLGLTTVKFDATVCNWDAGTTTAVDMPINVN